MHAPTDSLASFIQPDTSRTGLQRFVSWCLQREHDKPKRNIGLFGQALDRSLRMWRFTARLPHHLVKLAGFKIQQVPRPHPLSLPA